MSSSHPRGLHRAARSADAPLVALPLVDPRPAPADERAPADRGRDRAQAVAVVVALVVGIGLRCWRPGRTTATFDEAFTGVYSRLPVREIPGALRAEDAHPPLDYLLRHWWSHSGNIALLRAPSIAIGITTLALVALWMRGRSWFGVTVVAITACSSFQLLYARTARPYALLVLCGAIAAIAAERHLRGERGRWHLVAAGAVLVALFDHTTGVLLAGGLLLVPGLDRGRDAWRWRAWIAGAGAIWVALWGPSLLDQARRQNAGWIPLTTPAGLLREVNGLVDMTPALALPVGCALVAGGIALHRRDPVLGRVWLCLFVAPVLAAGAVGLHTHFLLARSLAISAWAPALALAALVEMGGRSRPAARVVAVALLGAILVPSVLPAIDVEDSGTSARELLGTVVEPGDAVVVRPDWFWPLMAWERDAARHEPVPNAVAALGGSASIDGDAPFTGVVWLLHPRSYPYDVEGLTPCGEWSPPPGDWLLRCYATT
jgi:hypothetical protein